MCRLFLVEVHHGKFFCFVLFCFEREGWSVFSLLCGPSSIEKRDPTKNLLPEREHCDILTMVGVHICVNVWYTMCNYGVYKAYQSWSYGSFTGVKAKRTFLVLIIRWSHFGFPRPIKWMAKLFRTLLFLTSLVDLTLGFHRICINVGAANPRWSLNRLK